MTSMSILRNKNRRLPHLVWMQQVRNRLTEHVTAKTTDHTTSRIHRINPLDTYFSPSRDKVASTAPFFVLPSSLLPPGHVIAVENTSNNNNGISNGTPFLVHRDKTTNQVRAYVNQCRHRGAPLVKMNKQSISVPLKGSSLVCPYHSWTYDVKTGHLKGVPGEKRGFPCLDKDQHALQKLHCFESAGGIWAVTGKKDYTTTTTSTTTSNTSNHNTLFQPIDSELSALLTLPSVNSNNIEHNDCFVGYREWYLNANWQLLVETFLESYHVQSLHKETLGQVAHSNIMVTDKLITDELDGSSSSSLRMTVPLKNFDPTVSPLLGDNGNNVECESFLDSFLSQTTTTYLLFPSTGISLFKRFALFLSILPCHDRMDSNDRLGSTKSHVRAWATSHERCRNEDSNLQRRDLESVLTGIEEDWECAEHIQHGLNGAAAKIRKEDEGEKRESIMFSYGRFEGNNVAFLNNVNLASQKS